MEQIGYRQIIDYDIDILYFINQSIGKEIGFEKSNHISMPYALTLLHYYADLEYHMTGLFKFIPNIVKEKLIKLLKIYSMIANGFWIQIAIKNTG